MLYDLTIAAASKQIQAKQLSPARFFLIALQW